MRVFWDRCHAIWYIVTEVSEEPTAPTFFPASTQYLGSKLNWKDHIIKKRKQMDLRHKELYWFLGGTSHLSVDNELLLYKSIITPIWTHGFELWSRACKSNIAVIQRCQSKILRAIVDAPWYVINDMIPLYAKSSTTEVSSTVQNYNPTRTHYSNPFHGTTYTKTEKTVAS
jgi:hypothetical protein